MRDEKIDFYKGVLMFGVIWGHTITALAFSKQPVWIHTFLRTYDMPFFMIISGFFMAKSCKKDKLFKLIVNKTTQILLPVFIWSAIKTKFQSLDNYYFLWAVFMSSVIMAIIEKATKQKWLKILLYIIVISVLNCQDYYFWNLSYLFPFFVLGAMGVWQYDYKMKIMVPAFVIMQCYWSTDYSVWVTGTNIIASAVLPPQFIFRFMIGFCGIFVMRFVFNLLYTTGIKNFFCKIGKETMLLYIFQAIVIEYCLNAFCHRTGFSQQIFFLNSNIWGYFIAPVISLATLHILYKVIIKIKKIKYAKYFIGFKVFV